MTRPRSRPWPARLAWALGAAGVCLVAAIGLARVEVDTSTESFLPADDPEVDAWASLQRSFGADPLVVVIESETPEALLSPQSLPELLRLEGALAQLPDVAVLYGPATTINQIAGQAQTLLAELSGRRDGLRARAEQEATARGASPEEVAAAVASATEEFDRRYGGLLVSGLPAGLPTLKNAQFARSLVFESDGDVRSQFRFLVPDRTHVTLLVRPRESMDQAATSRLVSAVEELVTDAELDATEILVTGAPAISSGLAERVTDEVPLLATAAGAAVLISFVILGRGLPIRRRLLPFAQMLAGVAVTFATLGWIGVPVTIGGLAVVPVLLGVGTDLPIYIQRRAPTRLVVAVMLAAAAGYLVLALSPLPFVRQLGVALASGVAASATIGLVLRRRWPDAQLPRPTVQPVLIPAGRGEARWRRWALVGGLAVATLGWSLLPGIRVDADPMNLVGDLASVRDATEAERILGASGELAVVLRGPDVLAPEALGWFTETESRLAVDFGDRLRPVATPHRLLGWLGSDATADQVDAAVRLLPPYLLGTSVRPDRQEAAATFGLRLADLSEQSALIDAVRETLPDPPEGMQATVAGLPVVAARGYELVAGQRVVPNILGILAFGLALLATLGDHRSALRAVMAAAMAFGWGIVFLRATGTALTPLTVTLGTLTAAVGGEFAVVHASLRNRRGASRAIAAAVLTSSAGFFALALSEVAVLRNFGLVLAGSVVLAAPAAWLVMPAGRGQRVPASRPDGAGPGGGVVGSLVGASR